MAVVTSRSIVSRMLFFVAFLAFALADQNLRILQPISLQIQFPPAGYVQDSPALFGVPPYGRSITGTVIWGTPGDRDGCQPINRSLTNWPTSGPVIVLVDRGNCTFVTKVRNAQNAGANAAIVADNVNENFLPYMADDGTGASITIPSVFINYSAGQTLEGALQNPFAPVVATMTWDLPNPDNVVEWLMWTSSNDAASLSFKSIFGEAVDALGNAAVFTPYYYILDGVASGCTSIFDCGNQCTNQGRYCASDPDHDPSRGVSGADIVTENLRQMCMFRVLNSTSETVKWWDYVRIFNTSCAGNASTWSKSCSDSVLTMLGIDATAVETCFNTSGGVDTGSNYLMDDAINKKNEDGIFYLPTVYINTQAYRGSLSCPAPISPTSCGVLQAICAGYPEDALPCACSVDNPGCPLCEERDACGVCGGDGQFDACNQCLAPTNPNFNKSCAGCDGVPGSGAKYDSCGICNGTGSLDACLRCVQANDSVRIEQGEGGWDACGVCLKYNDTRFNQSCLGCDGVPNSKVERDACGVCGGSYQKGACPGGLSVSAIVGITIGCVAGAAAIIFCIMKRQQAKMRSEVENVLSRYQLRNYPEGAQGLMSGKASEESQTREVSGGEISQVQEDDTTQEEETR